MAPLLHRAAIRNHMGKNIKSASATQGGHNKVWISVVYGVLIERVRLLYIWLDVGLVITFLPDSFVGITMHT